MRFLMLQPRVTERFEITYLANFGERPADHPIHNPDFLATCDIVIWQTAFGCTPPDFLSALPAACRQIRFPTLTLKFLWPLHMSDPRNAPEPGFPYGRYAYGDRLLMRLMQQGVAVEDLARRYIETDINKMVNLDRLGEMSFEELQNNDRQSDIAIAAYTEATFRRRRLFHTINHPAFDSLYHLYQALESALLGEPVREGIILPFNAKDALSDAQIPIHPQIVSHFKLSWISPVTKWRYNSSLLTLEEYIRAYGEFRAIPMGSPPQLWLARAQQAAVEKDLNEARRILIEATAEYPTLPHFLHLLATLLLRVRELAEGERVLRFAIARFPQVALLQNELGVLKLRQNSIGEAVGLFNAALQIDPQYQDARRNLEQAIQQQRLTHSGLR